MQFKLLSLAALASTVLADGSGIISALATITSDTISLNDTVSSWDGGLLTLIPIVAASSKLLHDIKEGTIHAKAADPLTFDETISVATATIALATDVGQVVDTLIAAKPKFDKLLVVSPIILLNLHQEQQATDLFSAAVIEKVPAPLQETAKGLIKPIDDNFNRGIKVFGPWTPGA
ncbi:hypothetical protein PT974_09940 [Cladobotryum mycophilum]|uniref:Antigenic cell wall galactomannoprotein n=1 Tax=Cladobotryum mycophilum TaxID=491253 RepID=A0ABR0S9E2_9HYPO